jgi:hypothetical protein
MPKAYTYQTMTKPASPTGTAVAGGALMAGVPYYYRVIGVRANGSMGASWLGKTPASDEFSATTTTDNKSITISFTQPAGEGVLSYRIFRSTTTGGMLNNGTAMIAYHPADSAVRSGTTITFTDTGYGAGSNAYLNIDSDPRGVLTVTGAVTGDRVSIVDIYNADVANGWGVILKLDDNTYKVNCYLICSTGQIGRAHV